MEGLMHDLYMLNFWRCHAIFIVGSVSKPGISLQDFKNTDILTECKGILKVSENIYDVGKVNFKTEWTGRLEKTQI